MNVSDPRSQRRIIGAFLVGSALVLFTLLIRPTTAPAVTSGNEIISPVVVADFENRPITIIDSNGDGVPDWEESLQRNSGTLQRDSSITSAYEAPETLTDQFALDLFERMVNGQVYGDFSSTPEEIVAQSSDQLLAQAVDTLITVDDITISNNNSAAALISYGEQVAVIINTYKETSGENEAQILERALATENPAELQKLDAKITTYQNYLKYTQALAVPSSVAAEHLLLINSYLATLNNIIAMRNAFTDPILALVRLKRYQEDADVLFIALIDTYTKLIAGGARWPAGSAVHNVISIQE